MKANEVVVASVVRDKAMYERCVGSNPFFEGCSLFMLDNSVENKSVTSRYNTFLESDACEGDVWIVLCHEDWEPLENVCEKVRNLDRNYLWGNIGIFVEEQPRVDVLMNIGYVKQSKKDSDKRSEIVGREIEARVDTFDCQCIIMHSSLVKRFGLRFDEKLSFDMYVEEFCIRAYEQYGIQSRTLMLDACHHSTGNLSESFYASLEYVRAKFAVTKKRYATIVGHNNVIGGTQSKKYYKWKRIPLRRLRYRLGI